jgi:serine/threonine protein kinase
MSVPGRLLGSYVLEELLGQGGMGDAWRARVSKDASPSSLVALGGRTNVCIKVIKRELANNDKAVDMFLREAKLAARLQHPGIVRILELGRDNGSYFLVMELLDGLAWHDIAQRFWRHGKTLPIEAIVRAAAEAAQAMQYAHTLVGPDGTSLGMVHRDISPDNLFLSKAGNTKVLDFGIAKATSVDATRLTDRGELRGKLPYMPPEQVRTDDVDGRADQWALGISLYYLTTAQRPFDRDTPLETMNAIISQPPTSAMHMNPNVPASLGEVIVKALAKDPAQRFSSAHAMGDALLSLLPAEVPNDVMQRLLNDAHALPRGDRRPLSAPPSAPLWQWQPRPVASASSISFEHEDQVATLEARSLSASRVPSTLVSNANAARPTDASPTDSVSDDGMATLRLPVIRTVAMPTADITDRTMPGMSTIAEQPTRKTATPKPSMAPLAPGVGDVVDFADLRSMPTANVQTLAELPAMPSSEALGVSSLADFGVQLQRAMPPAPLAPTPARKPTAAPLPSPVVHTSSPPAWRVGLTAFLAALSAMLVLLVAIMFLFQWLKTGLP